MSKSFLKLVPALLLLSAAAASAEGVGVRGGGEVVDINGELFLRDIVEKSVCDSKTGSEMLAAAPATEKLLAAVEKLDWYFALELKRELRFLRFCMTGTLKPLMTDRGRNVPAEPSDLPSIF